MLQLVKFILHKTKNKTKQNKKTAQKIVFENKLTYS